MISILKILVGNKNISFAKSVCFILILISAPLLFSQRIFLDNSIEKKNELFEKLGVKKQIVHQKYLRVIDSTITFDMTEIFYVDTSGYIFKGEKFNSNERSIFQWKNVIDYIRDLRGNIVKIYYNNELNELRVYDDSNRVNLSFYYEDEKLTNTLVYKFDSLGNQIKHLTKYSNGWVDTEYVAIYDYDFSTTVPQKKSISILNTGEKIYFSYDSLGRIVFGVHFSSNGTAVDSSLYIYNDEKQTDSLISVRNGKKEKIVKRYDHKRRHLSSKLYNEMDSITYEFVSVYKDDKNIIIDSTRSENKIVVNTKHFDETGKKTSEKISENGVIRYKSNWKYFSNNLLKQFNRIDYKNNQIEETTYEYEFY